MKRIVFSTNNAHKVDEIKAALGGGEYEILTLKECEIFEDIPETADTLEGNASLKSRYVADRLHQMGIKAMVFADDTGLEIDALGGAPGVYSARYSGEGTQGNMDKVLRELDGNKSRGCQFRTVISLIEEDGSEELFEGIVRGEILEHRDGTDGFGYDPIFRPMGYEVSFARMSMDEKNSISHRGLAVRKMVDYLRG